MAIPLAPIIEKTGTTNIEAEEFLQTFIEWSKPSDIHNVGDSAQKKKPTIAEFKTHLKSNESSWKDWKYAVLIKVPLIRGIEKKRNIYKSIMSLMELSHIRFNFDYKLLKLIDMKAKLQPTANIRMYKEM